MFLGTISLYSFTLMLNITYDFTNYINSKKVSCCLFILPLEWIKLKYILY